MARGHQKIQSQQKNAEKQAKMKKAQGSDQKKAAQAALVFSCTVCKACILIFSCTLAFGKTLRIYSNTSNCV